MKRDCRCYTRQNHRPRRPIGLFSHQKTSALQNLARTWRSASLARRARRGGTYTPDKGRRSIFLSKPRGTSGHTQWSIPHGNSHLTGPNTRHIIRPGVVLVSIAIPLDSQKPSRVDIVDASSHGASRRSPWRFALMSRLWLQYIAMGVTSGARRAGRSGSPAPNYGTALVIPQHQWARI